VDPRLGEIATGAWGGFHMARLGESSSLEQDNPSPGLKQEQHAQSTHASSLGERLSRERDSASLKTRASA